MKELLAEVQASVFMEYRRAAEEFGPANNGPHESYAVIKEEFEEAVEQSGTFEAQLECFWREVKANDLRAYDRLRIMREFAEHAAAEWIQVAAMCYKATKKKGDAHVNQI